jgi:hypothetical protein
MRIADFAEERGGSDGSDTSLFAECRALLVEEFIDYAFRPSDLGASPAILIDERDKPGQAVATGSGRRSAEVEAFKEPQPGLDLAWVGSRSRISVGSLANWSWA